MADKLMQAAQLEAVQGRAKQGEATAAARKCWHKPQLTVLPVEQTQKQNLKGMDASDSISSAS